MKFRFLAVVVGVVALVLIAHDIPLASHISRVERERLITTLERDAYILGSKVSAIDLRDTTESNTQAELVLEEFTAISDATAVIIDSKGYLVASTSASDNAGEDYTTRPEVASALLGRFTSGVRSSNTIGENLVYVAVPIVSGNSVLGVVRLTYPKSTIDNRVADRVRSIVIAAAVSIAMAILAAFLLASIIARPITNLRRATDSFARGDVSTQVDEQGPIETRQLAKSFNAMAGRVQNMLNRQRSFAGDAAHQIRTPLTALRLRLEQASNSVDSSPSDARDHIEAALNETDRLTNLTEQLLRLARTEGTVLDVAKIDVASMINEIVEEWSFLAAERGVELRTNVATSVECETNLVALREIITIYIDNAIEHAPNGSAITILASQKPNHLEITVRDQGPGLSADQRERAFDRFWRGSTPAATNKDIHGSGLGLAIAAQLATASNMQLELVAAPGDTGLDAVVKIKTN